MSSGFVMCFGVWGCFLPELEVVKWIESGFVQVPVQGVLKLDDALLN